MSNVPHRTAALVPQPPVSHLGPEQRAEIEEPLRGEIARLQADLGRIHGDIGLFAKTHFGLSDNLPTQETLQKMAERITAQKEGLTEAISAINSLLPMARGENWEDTQRHIDERTVECEQQRDIAQRALSAEQT